MLSGKRILAMSGIVVGFCLIIAAIGTLIPLGLSGQVKHVVFVLGLVTMLLGVVIGCAGSLYYYWLKSAERQAKDHLPEDAALIVQAQQSMKAARSHAPTAGWSGRQLDAAEPALGDEAADHKPKG